MGKLNMPEETRKHWADGHYTGMGKLKCQRKQESIERMNITPEWESSNAGGQRLFSHSKAKHGN